VWFCFKSECVTIGIIPLNDIFYQKCQITHDNKILYRDWIWKLFLLRVFDAYDKYLGFDGFIRVLFRVSGKTELTTTIYVHHGYGGGRLAGGHALTLQRAFLWNQADVALMGHRHIRARHESIYNKPVGNKVLTLSRVSAFCGTFKSGSVTTVH